MSGLFQLVYSSVKESGCDEREINKILDSCKRNNGSKNITGVLLHSDAHFIQYLEGPKDIINLYDLIKKDTRHKNIALLSYRMTKERFFPSWQMGYKDISGKNLELLTENTPEEKKVFLSMIKGEKITQNSAVDLVTSFFKKAS